MESGLVVIDSFCIRIPRYMRLLLSTRMPVSTLYSKSGLISMFNCRSAIVNFISEVDYDSLSIESRRSIMSFDYYFISVITFPTSATMSYISCLCCIRKAKLPACKFNTSGRTEISLIRFSSSITLFLRALSNLKALESLLSPDYIFSLMMTHTLMVSFPTDYKNYSLLSSLRLFLSSEGAPPYALPLLSLPASMIRWVSLMPGYFYVSVYC